MKKKIRFIGVLFLIGTIFLYFSCKGENRGQNKSKSDLSHRADASERIDQDKDKPRAEKQIFQCPMHPNYTSDKPGECPICGMDLVPVQKEEKKEEKRAAKKKIMYHSTMNPNEISDKPGKDSMDMVPFEVEGGQEKELVAGRALVRISPERQQTIGVKFDEVRFQPLHKMIKTVGRVDFEESAISYVSLKFEGWVEKLFVSTTGRMVKKGETLFEIYSPELVSAQQEYLLAHRVSASGQISGSLIKASRERLRLWDITDRQIEELERSGEAKRTLIIYSPRQGFVIEKNVIEGQKVMAGENLYKIADLSKVWVYGEIYEYELPFVKTGMDVRISLPYDPAMSLAGKISYIYPYLTPETRTNRIRIEVRNPEFKVKPEMYANLEIHVDYGTRLTIPTDAVLDSGDQKIIFLDKGNGYLEPRIIKVGVKAENLYEVLEGATAGERVVTSANFLVDSESSIKAALKQMAATAAGEHRHD